MSEDELKGYEVLLRIAAALEGLREEIRRMNDEGVVVVGHADINEN